MGSSAVQGAVFLDVDGTLVPGTTSSAYLAGFLGRREALVAAEEAYARGEMTNQQVSVIDARGWAGTEEAAVREWLRGLPLVAGIAETVAWCTSRGLVPVLATLAWEPVGRYLADGFGIGSFCGPRLEAARGRWTGRVLRHFDEYDKRDYCVAEADRLGVPMSACVAIGDSRSDLPLFAEVGCGIAFNGTPAARRAATAAADGDDLRAVLPLVERWLSLPGGH
ncbi:HAD family hydrolase [Streptomyces sp. NPDC014870]|uniref:HAD family hydrolase n=1 Tax=Streptomyces sp. NPDC014870 TaxID=3364925 RepID=UPI0036F8F5F5